MDRLQTFPVPCGGGLVQTLDNLQQGNVAPGSAKRLTNFEPATGGGYSRVLGYSKFDTAAVTGTGAIQGVANFGTNVLAVRDNDIYSSGGSGWTKINGDVRTGGGINRFHRYILAGTERIMMVNGSNHAAKWDGTTYTVINHVNAPTAPSFVVEFQQHVFLAQNDIITFSAPNDDEDFAPGSGGGEVKLGDEITGLIPFRDQLIVFCRRRIYRITGTDNTNFQRLPITENLGCVYPDSIQEVAGDIVFLGPDGLRSLAATERNNDFDLGNVSSAIKPAAVEFIANYSRICSTVIRTKSQYRLFGYSSGIQSSASEGIIGVQRDTNQYEWALTRGFKCNVADSDVDTNGNERIVFGNDDGYIYVMESGNTFDCTTIEAMYQTPYYDMQDVYVRKGCRKLKLFNEASANYQVNAQLLLDYDETTKVQPEYEIVGTGAASGSVYGSVITLYGTATFGSSNPPKIEGLLVGAGLSGSLVFTITTQDAPFTMKTIALEYSLGGRR